MTTPASPQPGNRDPLGDLGRAVKKVLLDPNSWKPGPTQALVAAAAEQPGTGGEADDEPLMTVHLGHRIQEYTADDSDLLVDDGDCPAPSAGQDTGPWRVGESWGIHVYEGEKGSPGERPVATFHRAEDAARAVAAVNATQPAPDDHSAAGNATRRQEAGQDTERLRDELAEIAQEIEDLGYGFGITAAGDSARNDLVSFRMNESVSNTLRDFSDRIRRALGGTTGQP